YMDLFSTYTSDRYFNRVFQSTRISTNSNLIIENEQLNELQNDVSFLDSNLKIQWRPSDKDEISLSALYLKNDLDYKIEDIIDQRTNTDELDLKNQGITLNWKRDWNPYWRHSFQTYYSDYVSDYLFSDNNISGLEEGNRRFNSVEDFGISVETVFQPNEKNVWSLGYQYYNTQVEFVLSRLDDLQEDFLDSSSSNLNSHNIFLNYEKQWKQFILNAGLRTTFLSSLQNWYFEPRINTTYKLSNAWALSASAEVKNQAISQFIEIESPLQLANNIWTIADDEDYFVINSQQLTFGVTYNKNSWNIDVEAYYKKLNNLSSYLRGFSNVATTNTDLFSKGSGETLGIDLLIKKKVNNYNTWIGYTLSRTRQEFPDIQTESFPSLSDKTHSLQWINQYKWNQLELSLGAQYSTGNPYTRGIGISEDENQDFFIEYGPINNSRLRDYFRLDGSIFYNFKSKSNDFVKAKLGISFINLLNRENELNRTYAIDEFSDDETPEVRDLILEEETILGLRFTPNIVFRYWF
ncbi:MAG: TonB-dependent receptor, partial [Bacteroidota bacterium]